MKWTSVSFIFHLSLEELELVAVQEKRSWTDLQQGNVGIRGKKGCLCNLLGFDTVEQSQSRTAAEDVLKHAHRSALTLMYE